jgi:hypothetical protein
MGVKYTILDTDQLQLIAKIKGFADAAQVFGLLVSGEKALQLG